MWRELLHVAKTSWYSSDVRIIDCCWRLRRSHNVLARLKSGDLPLLIRTLFNMRRPCVLKSFQSGGFSQYDGKSLHIAVGREVTSMKSAWLTTVALPWVLFAVRISFAQSTEDLVLTGAATQTAGNVAAASLHDAMARDIKAAFSRLTPGLADPPLRLLQTQAKDPGQSPAGSSP